MSFQISFPFHALQITFSDEITLTLPLSDTDNLRIGQPLHLVIGQYAEALQRHLITKGKLQSLLAEWHAHPFQKAQLQVDIPAATDGISYPDCKLALTYWMQPKAYGLWGIIPTMDVEAFAKNSKQLEARLRAAVLTDLQRRKLLANVQDIVAILRLEQQQLSQQDILLRLPNLELPEEATEEAKIPILPKVAQRLAMTSPVTFGRSEELQQLERALKGTFTQNVLLVGASGVGKTALVWEIVRQSKKRKIKGYFWETTASVLIKELSIGTGWKDNLSSLITELQDTRDWLFVRNLHELFEVGQYEGSQISLADYLRTFINRGDLRIVSECTPEELARIEVRNPGLLSLFQIIRISEPPSDAMMDIVIQKVRQLARRQQLFIAQDTIAEVMQLNRRFMPYSGFPGQPIRFLERMILSQPEPVAPSKKKRNTPSRRTIDRSEVIRYFCDHTGMPQLMIDRKLPIQPAQLRQYFNEQVFGQQKAVEALVHVLTSVKTGLARTGQPIASLLFVGPTGVGKTELAKVLAKFMFGNRKRMIRFDMSEYSDFYAVQRLIGMGQQEDGLLTAAVRRDPFSVVLFDEIEKADRSFYDLMLGVLGEGRLTDNRGRTVNFCSTIIIMTSNIGAEQFSTNKVSFKRGVDAPQVEAHFTRAVENAFRPELRNRIDQIIAFAPLSKLVMQQVIRREMQLFRQREGMRSARLHLQIDDKVLDYLATKGYDPLYGARYLQRTMRQELIIPLAKAINTADVDSHLNIAVKVVGAGLQVSTAEDEMELDLLLEELEKEASADTAAELRRAVIRLQEGHFYIKMRQDCNRLEQLKRRNVNEFWNNATYSRLYAHYQETAQRLIQLEQDIRTYEDQLALAVMNRAVYRPEINEQIEAWRAAFFQLKLDMYAQANPNSNRVHIGIYGSDVTTLLGIYDGIIRLHGYTYRWQSVWHRQSYYNELIEHIYLAQQEESEELQTNTVLDKRADYLKKIETTQEKAMNASTAPSPIPSRKTDTLVGVELEIVGAAAHLFFQAEDGFQEWKVSDKSTHLYYVEVSARA
ncbi:MAG: AAA family ATPase, partial [Bacteroidota bacterium]